MLRFHLSFLCADRIPDAILILLGVLFPRFLSFFFRFAVLAKRDRTRAWLRFSAVVRLFSLFCVSGVPGSTTRTRSRRVSFQRRIFVKKEKKRKRALGEVSRFLLRSELFPIRNLNILKRSAPPFSKSSPHVTCALIEMPSASQLSLTLWRPLVITSRSSLKQHFLVTSVT